MEKVPEMKCGKTKNQVKAGYNGSGSQCCKCKECGIYDTISPKQHACPEDARKLAIKMYYAGVSGRAAEKILRMNKSNDTLIRRRVSTLILPFHPNPAPLLHSPAGCGRIKQSERFSTYPGDRSTYWEVKRDAGSHYPNRPYAAACHGAG